MGMHVAFWLVFLFSLDKYLKVELWYYDNYDNSNSIFFKGPPYHFPLPLCLSG